MNGLMQAILPPAVLKGCKRILGKYYTGRYARWDQAVSNSMGYDADRILDKVAEAVMKVKSGEAVYERDSVIFDKIEYSFPLLAGLLRVAALNGGMLDVLDFGGSLGSTYYQCRGMLSGLKRLRWNIVEQPNFVGRGRKDFSTEEIAFYYSIEECLDSERPDVLVLSSVLQYLERPHELIGAAMDHGFEHIIIDRTPCIDLKMDLITVQNVPPEIYRASYPSWLFSTQKLVERLSEKYSLVAEFPANDSKVHFRDLLVEFKGFIFEKRK